MIMPRHTVTWGERLKTRRKTPKTDAERCTQHLVNVGELETFSLAASKKFWEEDVGMCCSLCPHALTCELLLENE